MSVDRAQLTMSSKLVPNRLARSMMDSTWSSLVFTGLTFLIGIIIARLLGPAGRGSFGEIQYWAALIVALGGLSTFDGMVYYVRDGKHDPVRCVSSFLMVGLGLAVLTSAAFIAFHEAGILKLGYKNDLLVTAFMVLFITMNFQTQAFISLERSRMNFSFLVIERMVTPTFYALFLLALFLFSRGTIATALAALALSSVPMLAVWVWKMRRDLWSRPSWTAMRAIVATGLRFHGSAAMLGVSTQLDRLVIVLLWPPEMIGLYFVAYSAAGATFSLVGQALRLVILPALTGLEPAHRASRLAKAMRVTVLLSAAIAVVVVAAAPIVIPLAFGPAFRPAVSYTQYLVLALWLSPLWIVVEVANRASGRGWPGVQMSLVSMAVFLAGGLITRYADPLDLMITMAISQFLSIVVAISHLVRKPVGLDLAEALIPRWGDVVEIWREGNGHLRHTLARLRMR